MGERLEDALAEKLDLQDSCEGLRAQVSDLLERERGYKHKITGYHERERQQGAQSALLASVRQQQDEEASRLLVQVVDGQKCLASVGRSLVGLRSAWEDCLEGKWRGAKDKGKQGREEMEALFRRIEEDVHGCVQRTHDALQGRWDTRDDLNPVESQDDIFSHFDARALETDLVLAARPRGEETLYRQTFAIQGNIDKIRASFDRAKAEQQLRELKIEVDIEEIKKERIDVKLLHDAIKHGYQGSSGKQPPAPSPEKPSAIRQPASRPGLKLGRSFSMCSMRTTSPPERSSSQPRMASPSRMTPDQMSREELGALNLKGEGNALVSSGDYKTACQVYLQALCMVAGRGTQAAHELEHACNLNLAHAALMSNDPATVITACDRVLERCETELKALYRRSQARALQAKMAIESQSQKGGKSALRSPGSRGLDNGAHNLDKGALSHPGELFALARMDAERALEQSPINPTMLDNLNTILHEARLHGYETEEEAPARGEGVGFGRDAREEEGGQGWSDAHPPR